MSKVLKHTGEAIERSEINNDRIGLQRLRECEMTWQKLEVKLMQKNYFDTNIVESSISRGHGKAIERSESC